MKVKVVKKPDVGTDYYVDINGIFVASFTRDTPIEAITEIAPNTTKVDTDIEPPAGGPWKWNGTGWVLIPPTYDKKRAVELEKLRQQDQLDALLKLATMTDAQKSQIVPDKTADPGTPEWLIGNVNDIKTKYPKPSK